MTPAVQKLAGKSGVTLWKKKKRSTSRRRQPTPATANRASLRVKRRTIHTAASANAATAAPHPMAGHAEGCLSDQSLRCAVPRVAGGESEGRHSCRVDDGEVRWIDHHECRHVVQEASLGRRDEDLITGNELVQVEERMEVRRAVAGDRSIAGLTRQRGVVVVAGTELEV